MKSLRWIVIGSLSLALAGCGVFFAPLQGRWNPADPNRDEGTVITASVSGYVDSTPSGYFTSDYMLVGNMDTQIALLKFPTADLPRVVVHAQLELYVEYASASSFDVAVFPILQDWDTSVSFDTVKNSLDFKGTQAGPSVQVNSIGWCYWDVTSALKNTDPQALKGFLVKDLMYVSYYAQFYTHRVSGYAPRLRVYGY